jgi:hypothetical protein
MADNTPDWSARIAAWRASGKSGAAWCRDNGIGYYQFQYWRDKLRQSKRHVKAGHFVPIKVAATALRIECNGIYLHVSSGFDPVLLREVVSALREN